MNILSDLATVLAAFLFVGILTAVISAGHISLRDFSELTILALISYRGYIRNKNRVVAESTSGKGTRTLTLILSLVLAAMPLLLIFSMALLHH